MLETPLDGALQPSLCARGVHAGVAHNFKEVRKCHGVMERDRPVRVLEPVEDWAAGWVEAVWLVIAQAQGPADSVSALPVGRRWGMGLVFRAIRSSARIAVHR
jgi:hypothetical protein